MGYQVARAISSEGLKEIQNTERRNLDESFSTTSREREIRCSFASVRDLRLSAALTLCENRE
jgi:hypothetical protein